MASNAPNGLIPLISQPLMAQALNIEIMHLIARMMDMKLGPLKEEKAMMIHLLPAPIQMQKRSHIPPRVIEHQLTSLEVKPGRVELIRLREVGHAGAKMAQLMHRRGALLEALRAVHAALLRARVVVGQLWRVAAVRDGGLAEDQVEGEVVDGVGEGDAFAAAGGFFEVVDRSCVREGLGREFEVREAVDGEGGAAEGVFGPFYGAVDEGLGAVAFVEDFVRVLGDDCETKV